MATPCRPQARPAEVQERGKRPADQNNSIPMVSRRGEQKLSEAPQSLAPLHHNAFVGWGRGDPVARPSPSCCALSGGSGGPPDRPYTHKLRIGHANMAWRNLSTAERSDTARVRIALPGPWRNLGYRVSDQTVGNILKRHSIPPAPEREKSTTWNEFIRSHMEVLAATDFFTAEVCTKSGLVTYYVLFFMHLATRRVHIAGITPYPDG